METKGFDIPRLRGLRKMECIAPMTDAEYKQLIQRRRGDGYEYALAVRPKWTLKPRYSEYSSETRRMEKKFLIKDGYQTTGVRWGLIHGKRRKAVKYWGKYYTRHAKAQYDMWNRYAGRNDVMYISARIGTGNWSDFHWSQYTNEPWFIDAIDDTFDETYCDIYVKIDPKTGVPEGVNSDG